MPVTVYCCVFGEPPAVTDSDALVGLMLSEVNPSILCCPLVPPLPVVSCKFDG